jgi:hypothetical protein
MVYLRKRNMRNVREVRMLVPALAAIPICVCGQTARADVMMTFTGNLTSDGSAVGSGDPVISDPFTINPGGGSAALFQFED